MTPKYSYRGVLGYDVLVLPKATKLGNKADGSAGFNPALQPQRSGTAEVGAKGVYRELFYSVAGFRTRAKRFDQPLQLKTSRSFHCHPGR